MSENLARRLEELDLVSSVSSFFCYGAKQNVSLSMAYVKSELSVKPDAEKGSGGDGRRFKACG